MNSTGLGVLFAVGGMVMLILGIVGLVLYLLFAFGLFKMAQKENLEYSWFAFIPVLQFYILGKLITELKIFSLDVPSPELVLPVAALLSGVTSGIRVIGPLISLAVMILEIAAFYWLFRKYKGDKATLMTILSVILPFMGPIYIFTMRDADPINDSTHRPN